MNTFRQRLLFGVTALTEGLHIYGSLGSGQSHNCKAELPIAWLSLKSCLEAGRWEPSEESIDKPRKPSEAFYTRQAKPVLTLKAAKPNL